MDTYYIGNRGEMVQKIQSLFKKLGYAIDVDGIYGEQTKTVVKKYQKANQLEIDGIMGPNTLESLLIKNGYSKAEAYVNSRDFYSDTKNFIYVNTDEYYVYIFEGRNKTWKLTHKFFSAVGKKETPTLKGIFTVKAKGEGYTKEEYGFKVKWYTQYYKNYLFHSILFNLDGSVFDGRLGLDISDGCIRLKEEDSKYIYDHIPYGSLVVIL